MSIGKVSALDPLAACKTHVPALCLLPPSVDQVSVCLQCRGHPCSLQRSGLSFPSNRDDLLQSYRNEAHIFAASRQTHLRLARQKKCLGQMLRLCETILRKPAAIAGKQQPLLPVTYKGHYLSSPMPGVAVLPNIGA